MHERQIPSVSPEWDEASLPAHVIEKHNRGSTGKESDFNESIYSTWAEMIDLGSDD